MNKENEFETLFLRILETVSDIFISGEISAAMGLKAQISLENIKNRENTINEIKIRAIEHYSDNKFKNSKNKIVYGLNIMLMQIQNLKIQLSENESIEESKGLHFDKEKFEEGYAIVKKEIKTLQKN